uniref:Small ribosomal subunit protein uS3c n=1 Tax=Colemanosphaera angeleri TaxID=1454018 RepID=A0A6C0RVU7_9CHLO|nr:ribosomal protein S3 [Colemanosphaera angeleri]QIA47151.1 ribosomal protein S3 [Colemanosphaera angeleri]
MGQKVHPLGFRVGITKKHQSQWFAKFQKYGYSQTVLEDHMLRKTLLNLFNNMSSDPVKSSKSDFEKENAVATKQAKKAGANLAKKAKITQIKIERGLIPYEIGIQIHSDDCLTITKAIDDIKISTDLVSKLQKTRKYLFKAGTQFKKEQKLKTLNTTSASLNSDVSISSESKKRKFKIKVEKQVKGKTLFKSRRKQKKRLSKALFMRLKNIKKRFKKRQNIKKLSLNLISKGLLIRKKGALIIRKVKINRKNKKAKILRYTQKKNSLQNNKPYNGVQKSLSQRFKNRMCKKFANLFLTKLNKQFLVRLKAIMKFWYNQKTTQAPLGYNKKWYSTKAYALINSLKAKSLSKDSKVLASYQVEKLTKLISILEKKSLTKMESLRKDFITFGTLSKTRAFGYYQMITFLKQLKELVTKLKKQVITTVNKAPYNILTKNTNKTKIQTLIKTKSKQKKAIIQKLVNNIINLVDNNKAMTNETRKIKWISYLKHLVNKHRTQNIFYYLATIADARKDLKALKRYTKQHSNFLFGVNIENGKENPNGLLQRVTKTLIQASNNCITNKFVEQESSEGLTRLQKAFLTQIENQRKMYKANLALIPKISIKFFSVKTTDILEKASIVADSIVDALEKRKAFRGVIKKAKEDLMRRSRIKGVKIQVSGRLNGAEIARSEWVRAGRVPLQTLRANIDYSYRTANTIYGIIGVKVWIFKGYSKIN